MSSQIDETIHSKKKDRIRFSLNKRFKEKGLIKFEEKGLGEEIETDPDSERRSTL